MPPLGLAPIINQLKESVENAKDVRALQDSFRRIIEAFEAVEDSVNGNFNDPALEYGLLTHRLEDPRFLPNYLRLIAGSNITLTRNNSNKTMEVATAAANFDPNKRFAYIAPTGLGSIDSRAVGDSASVIAGSSSFLTVTSTEFPLWQFLTGGVSGNAGGIVGAANVLSLGLKLNIYAYLADSQIFTIRKWFAVTSLSGASQAANDSPAGDYIGFRFSTGVPDTNLQCITKVTPNETVVDSGIAASATGKLFSMHFSGAGTIIFKINGVQVGQSSTNIPAGTVAMKYVISIATLQSAAAFGEFGWMYYEVFK